MSPKEIEDKRPFDPARPTRGLDILLLGERDRLASLIPRLTGLGHNVRQTGELPKVPCEFDLVLLDQAQLERFTGSPCADRAPQVVLASTAQIGDGAPLNWVAPGSSPRELQLALHLAIAERQSLPAPPAAVALADLAQPLDLLLDSAYLLDSEARLHYVNPAACAAHGWPRETLLDKRVYEIDDTLDRHGWPRLWRQTIESGGGTLESRHLAAGGKSYPVEITANPIRHQGRLYILAFARDISEREQARTALQRQQQLAQRYLDIAGTMLVALDDRGRITLVNEKACQVLGYSEAELLGRDWFDTVLPASQRDDVRRVCRQLMTGDVVPVEHYVNRVLTRAGVSRTIRWHNSVLPDPEGNVRGILSSGEDITDEEAAARQRERRATLNKLLTGASRELFAAESSTLDAVIEDVLGRIGHHCGVDDAYSFECGGDSHRKPGAYEWNAEGVECLIERCALHHAATAPNWTATLQHDQAVIVADVDQLSGAWEVERELLRQQSVRAVLAVPVTGTRGLDGCIGFAMVRGVRHWLDEEIRILRLLGDLVSLALRNRRTLEELQTSEFRWKFALEGSGQGVWDWDLQSETVYFSPPWKRMLGYGDEEIGTDPEEWSRRVHPEDLPVVEAALKAHLDGRSPLYESEHRVRHKDGSYRWVLSRGMAVARDGDGTAIRLIGTHTDVTERQMERQRLIDSEAQLEAIFANSQVGIMLLTGYRILTRCNQRMADILGYGTPQEMVGISMRQLHLSQGNFVDFGKRFYDNLRERDILHIEYQLQRRDGQAIWCLLSGKALGRTHPPDLNKGVLWVVDDISHMKQTERELREQRDLFSGGPTMVFQWQAGPDWPVDFCSANVRPILGYSSKQLQSGEVSYASLIHPDDLPVISKQVEDYLARGVVTFEQEYRLRHAQGHYLTFYDYTQVQRDEQGEIRSIYGYLLDITLQRESEQERLRMQRELERARRMEALGQLTGGVAHEFNNMLAIIMGHAGLLRARLGSAAEPRLAGCLDHIEQAGSRAKDLILQMLTFSRPQENRPQRIALKPAVQESITLARGSLPSSIEIDYRPRSGLPDVHLDMGELQQLLTNLLINARDAMDGKGRIEVAVDLYRGEGEECQHCNAQVAGEWVQLSVEDNGHGIARDDLARIFEPFFSTKVVGEGTGLGLSVVLGIMERNKGHILVDSEPGAGTCFRLLFPPVNWEAEALAVPAQRPPEGVALKGRVLVVDDEPALTELMRELLHGRGLEVIVSNDSREALALLLAEKRQIDLLITDQTMPGLLGTELVRHAKGRLPRLKTILCTGHSEQVDATSAAGKGIDHYLLKPVEPERLWRAVELSLA
jgi:PAS domain S-box-containing protein